MQPRSRPIGSRLAAAVAVLAGLFMVYQLYVGGNPALAAACAGAFALTYYVFTARGAYTYRYLYPGLAGIAMFIVLPLVYTVWIGFTNYSSKNLLTFERASEILLDEVYQSSSVRYEFTLHAADHGYRIVLHTDAVAAPAPEAAPGAAPTPALPTAFITDVLPLTSTAAAKIAVVPLAASGVQPGDPLPLKEVIAHRDAIHALTVKFPDGTGAAMSGLREFTPYQALYQRN